MSGKKGNVGFMNLKIDLKKDCDRLEWASFRTILGCLISQIILWMWLWAAFHPLVLFNGGALEGFQQSRGIRQGDPLSPYIFVMLMEVLKFMKKDKCDSKLWDSVKTSRGGLGFSFLFFADDFILFGKANRKNCTNIKEALDSFYELYRQKVNNDKSRVYFSPNVLRERRDELCSCLDLHSIPNLGKYLGFPLKLLGTKNQEFDFVIERVQGRLSG